MFYTWLVLTVVISIGLTIENYVKYRKECLCIEAIIAFVVLGAFISGICVIMWLGISYIQSIGHSFISKFLY